MTYQDMYGQSIYVSFCVSKQWNSLPYHIRYSQSKAVFKHSSEIIFAYKQYTWCFKVFLLVLFVKQFIFHCQMYFDYT